MKRRYLQLAAYLVVFIVAFVVQMTIPINAKGEGQNNMNQLQVAVSLRYLETDGIVLEVANVLNKEQSLVSNLRQILDYVFQGFPTEGALQVRNAKRGNVFLRGQNVDGWWYPFTFSSTLDLTKNSEIGKMTAIKLQANSVQTYPIECENILALAASSMPNEKNDTAAEFRIKLPLVITMDSGARVRVIVVSEWLPLNIYVKKSSVSR